MKAKISYLNHSGFILETADFVAVFDLFTDPAGVLSSYENSGKPTVFFVSHSHYDHWNSGILSFQNTVPSLYILEFSCRTEVGAQDPAGRGHRLIYIEPYRNLDSDTLGVKGLNAVHAFGSTDEGVSFLLDTDAGCYFHAGDLNNWDWQDEDSTAVERQYRSELKRIQEAADGEEIVLAFLPVDGRLGETAFSGSLIFLEYIKPRYLIPMHLNGGSELPRKLRKQLLQSGEGRSTHVVSMTEPGMPYEIL